MSTRMKLLRIKEVLERIGKSRTAWYNALSKKSPYFEPDAPQPIRISQRSVRWLESDIDAYIEARVLASRGCAQ